MTRRLTVIAVGLIVLGAVAMAGPTFGFSTIASDRGVQVGTAEGEDAYLGMGSTNNGIDDEDGVDVVTLYNNLNSDMSPVDIEVIIENDNGELETEYLPSEINAEDKDQVAVACEEVDGQNDNDGGTATITVIVEQAVADGVTITDASLEDSFDYNCHPGEEIDPTDSGLDDASVTDMNQGETDESQTVEFQLTEDLPEEETVNIMLDVPNRIDYSSVTYDDDRVTGERSQGDYVITFEPDETMTAGEIVTITADGVDTDHQNADGDYDAEFERSDKEATELLEPAFSVLND